MLSGEANRGFFCRHRRLKSEAWVATQLISAEAKSVQQGIAGSGRPSIYDLCGIRPGSLASVQPIGRQDDLHPAVVPPAPEHTSCPPSTKALKWSGNFP